MQAHIGVWEGKAGSINGVCLALCHITFPTQFLLRFISGSSSLLQFIQFIHQHDGKLSLQHPQQRPWQRFARNPAVKQCKRKWPKPLFCWISTSTQELHRRTHGSGTTMETIHMVRCNVCGKVHSNEWSTDRVRGSNQGGQEETS